MNTVKRKSRRKSPETLKPATPPPEPVKPSDGPIFTAHFDDGITTRMSIYSAADNLDLERAIAVSRAAYSSRTRKPMGLVFARIIGARFESTEGVTLAEYTAEDGEDLVRVA